MTTIHMDWRRLELRAEGHANAGNHGEDIVCAGVSAIMTCLGQYMLRYELSMRPELTLRSGESKIRARPIYGWKKRTREAFQQAVDGLTIMAECYPTHGKIEEE